MTPTQRSRRSGLAALGATALTAALTPFGASSQSRTTRLVVAFPPGGPVDFVARTIAEQLGRELGQPVIVENKPGANGAIGAEYVARATPDGTTLWLTSVGAVAINPVLYERLPYDPQKDLAPVSMVVGNVEVLVVAANAPYNTGLEFIEAARQSRSTPLTMASSGAGSVPHLAMELLNDAAKINLVHVPYKGAAPAITDVIAGHVSGFFGDLPGLMPHIRSGKLKPIGIAAPKRHPLLPEVRTFDEMGVRGVDSDNWYAIFTARAVPAAEIDRINAALRRTLTHEAIAGKLNASGAQPMPSSPTELSAVMRSDTAKWAQVVRTKNVKPD